MARTNKTKFAILGLLHSVPLSGYDIKKISDTSIGYFWQENYGHIYPVLKTMKNEGLVVPEKEESKGNPPRIVYTITEKGRQEFDKWMSTRTEPDKYRMELLLKVFFGEFSSKEQIVRHLENTISWLNESLKEYQEVHTHLEKKHPKEEGSKYWLFTAKFGEKFARMQIEWCEECIAELINE
jgi:PadR family transcriptional regulator, regulatory protein AphA